MLGFGAGRNLGLENSFLKRETNGLCWFLPRGLLFLGSFRVASGCCMNDLEPLSWWPFYADLTIHSWSCEDWEHFFNKGIMLISDGNIVFLLCVKAWQVTLNLGNVIQKSLWKNGFRKPGPQIWLCHSKAQREQSPCSPGWLLNWWNWQESITILSSFQILTFCAWVSWEPWMFLNVHLLSLIPLYVPSPVAAR